jgi:MFS family permease
MREMARGLRYVLAHVEQFGLLLLALIFSVFGVSYNTLLPAMADRLLHAGPQGYGLLNAATGVGAMVGALVIARTGGGGRRGLWLFAASVVFPIVLLVFGLVTNLAVSLVLALSLGLLFMIQFTLINTLLQLRVADDMRGRVLSLYVLIWFGFSPFGNLAMGNLAEHWGLSLTIGLGAVVSMILALIVFALVPRLRRLL